MSQYVVIGTSPAVDTSVVVGPFRSEAAATRAWVRLTQRGFVAETCALMRIEEVADSAPRDGEEPS